MNPIISSSVNNISFAPGTLFTTRKSNALTGCRTLGKFTKQTLLSQKYILPLSTSVRLFPQFRIGCPLYHKSRMRMTLATGTDVTVEEPDSPVIDKDSEGESGMPSNAVETSQVKDSEGESGMPSNAVETSQVSSAKSDGSAPPAQSKRSRPTRKSEMPPVKNEELVPGAAFTGKVRSIQPFGAFVDFGAFTDGLVHVSRLSDSFVKDVGSVVSVGQEVKVRLVEANSETGRISLTMRESDDISKLLQSKDAPAQSDRTRPTKKTPPRFNQKRDEVRKSSKFTKGQELEGTVKNLARSGAFISLPEAEEGFLPTSEESDDGFANMMGGSSLQVGQQVSVRVLRITRGQVTLTMKKEDSGGLDFKLKQGVEYAATNPFVVAFRKNKDIAAFLDEREKEEPTENLTIEKTSEKVEGNVDQPDAEVDDLKVPDQPSSSDEKSVSVPSTVDEIVEDGISSKELDVASIATDTSAEITKQAEDAEGIASSSLQGQGDVVQSIEEVEVTPETVASEGSISNSDHLATEAPAKSGLENDGDANLTEQVADQIFSSESVGSEEVTGSQDDVPVAKDEVQIQTSSAEDEIPSSTPIEDEKVGATPEKNGSIMSSAGQIDAPTLESTENQVSEEVVNNQFDYTTTKNEVPIQTPATDNEIPPDTVVEDEKVASVPQKNGSVTNSNELADASSPNENTAKAAISPALVKKLRDETGAGMMDCKKALSETGGDIIKAQEFLRKKGLASADKKASRATAEGRIGSYIHDARIGVLIEVNCETDFVSRGGIFKDLVDDLAMQVAACPQVQYLVTDDVPKEIVEKEKAIEMQKEDLFSKPEQIRSKIVEGRIRKRLEELALLDQPYIKNDKVVVKDWVKQTIATIGENIKVKRFVRYNLGEGLEKKSQDFAAEVAAQTAAKPVSATTKEQPAPVEAKEMAEKPPKATVSAALVKQLREETGAGMMDCKKALSETEGDLEKAQEYLRKKGLSSADKKSSRLAAEGRIGSYIHDSRIGVLIEVNCETDFVGRSENFKELVDDLAMQVVACPQVQYVAIDDIPESIVSKEKELEMQREDLLSKPENIRERIVEGRISKRLGELALLEQPFIKNDTVLVKDLVKQTVAALGENIKVRRFIRFTLGEALEATKTE